MLIEIRLRVGIRHQQSIIDYLIAEKWTYPRKGLRRPQVTQEITDTILRMAWDNTSWG